MGIPDHLTYLLINLYEGQEATVRTGNRTTDWFQKGKGVLQDCIIATLLTYLLHRLHNEKRWAGGSQGVNKIDREISITCNMQMTPPLWQKVKKN